MHLEFPSPVTSALPQNNTVPARLFWPAGLKPGDAKRPAVICLPILNGDEDLSTMLCGVLVQRGIPAMMFTLPYYAQRGPPEGRRVLATQPRLFIDALNQAFADLRRAAALLASKDEIDPQKIGVAGISLGGIMSATAAGAEPRFYRAALLLAGGDLLSIIHHAGETRQLSATMQQLPPAERAWLEAQLKAIDPLTHAPVLRERALQGRVLMLNASEDEVIPRSCTEKLANALGLSNKVVWFDGLGHYTAMAELPRALRLVADFFAQDIPPNTKLPPPAPVEKTHLIRVLGFAQQLLAILTSEPASNRCHFLKVELEGAQNDTRPITGKLQVVIGDKGRFSIQWDDIAVVPSGAAGQSAFPWLATSNAVFAGSMSPIGQTNFLAYVNTAHLARLRAIAGAVGAVALIPDMAKRWVNAEADTSLPGVTAIRVTAQDSKKNPGFVRLVLSDDQQYLKWADVDISGFKGRLRFWGFQTNTVATANVFDPPSGLHRQEVPGETLQRMLAACLNLAGDSAQPPAKRATNGDASRPVLEIRDPGNHGWRGQLGRGTIAHLNGTPSQIGKAHAALLGDAARSNIDRIYYAPALIETMQTGRWFPERLADLEKGAQKKLPPWFYDESASLADALGLPRQDVLLASLASETLKTAGIALTAPATKDSRVLLAWLADTTKSYFPAPESILFVCRPERGHAWIGAGFPALSGPIAAMNEKGMAAAVVNPTDENSVGKLPARILLRDVIEHAATLRQAISMIRNSSQLYDVHLLVADKLGARLIRCKNGVVTVLEHGLDYPGNPQFSTGITPGLKSEPAQVLAARLKESHSMVDVGVLTEALKKPVTSPDNKLILIFAPQSLSIWCAEGGKRAPAAEAPYISADLESLLKWSN